MRQSDDPRGPGARTRRGLFGTALGAAVGLAAVRPADAQAAPAELILHNARITTLEPGAPEAEALAVADGRFIAVGTEAEVMPLRGAGTTVIDGGGRRVIPGLIDSHLHIIRGGLNYNMELRWDGVPSLADGMRMLKEQAQRTPPPQWVRVVGGFTEHQFAEKRLPTLAELNEAAPDTPVFILHLYDRALLNRAALRAVGYTRDTPEPVGGMIERDAKGEPTGLLLARPNALILYNTLAKGPKLPVEWQVNSTRHFMRELNRLGVTSAIDAGGGYQNYPEDYRVIEQLAAQDQLTVRIAYNLFTQKPKEELADFRRWTGMVRPGQGSDMYRHNGAGEMLVFSAADFEDFREPRPDLAPSMEADLEPVVRFLAENRWPFRLHATYDETISRSLDVFERVNRDVPLAGLNWFFDHAETISQRNLDRVKALGGGIAMQHRMAFQGEYFAERYGTEATQATPAGARHVGHGPAGRRRHRCHPGRQLQPLGLALLAGQRPHGGRPRHVPRCQPPRPRDRLAPVDRRLRLVLGRGRPQGPHRRRPPGRPGGARQRLPHRRRTRDQGYRIRAHRRRRPCRARCGRLSGVGAASAAGQPRLVASRPFWGLPARRG